MRTIKKFAIILFALLIGLSLASCTKSDEEIMTDLSVRYASGTNGVVSSASPYASQAGLEILEKGGNAFDAAVAVAFALGVVEPFASGIGGGGLMVAYNATTGEYVSYNFREFVPGSGTASNYQEQYVENFDLYYESQGGDPTNKDETYYENYRAYLDKQSDPDSIFSDGALSVGVPTEVSGLLTILEEQGSGVVTRQEVLAPAINYAENGFNVTSNLADTFAECIDNIKGIEGAEVFFVDQDFDNETLAEGDLLVQTDYAYTLKKIAEEGKAGFYQGEVAEAFLEAMESYGGLITQEDLDYAMNNYPVKITPVTGTYKGYTIASSNVPSSGGTILVETLNLLEYYEETYLKPQNKTLSDLGHNTAEYIHILATALELSYGDKRKYIADTNNDLTITNYIPVLTSKTYAEYRWESVYNLEMVINGYNGVASVANGFAYNICNSFTDDGGNTTYTCDYYGDIDAYYEWASTNDYDIETISIESSNDGVEPDEHYSTTSFSVTDKWGNIVSVTQTINHFFGSHIVPTSHDEEGNKTQGCGFFLNNQLGTCSFTGSSVNYVKPYKQPVSHIMPTIITKDGLPYATLGSPGSMRIPSTVIQVILNLIDFDMDIQDAIDAPRIFVYSTGGGDDESTEFVYPGSLDADGNVIKNNTSGKYLWIECASRSLIAKLSTMGYYIPLNNRYSNIDLYFGGVHGITFDTETGVMTGGADSRRDGKALAF